MILVEFDDVEVIEFLSCRAEKAFLKFFVPEIAEYFFFSDIILASLVSGELIAHIWRDRSD